MEDLESIYMVSGLNEDGKAFVTISAHGTKGTIIVGQMSPDQVREHALSYLSVAEASEQDAATWHALKDLEVPEHERLAAIIITKLRESRNQ